MTTPTMLEAVITAKQYHGARLTPTCLARALSRSKPITRQPFFDANLRQWQLTIAYIADVIGEMNPHFNRQRFFEECNK